MKRILSLIALAVIFTIGTFVFAQKGGGSCTVNLLEPESNVEETLAVLRTTGCTDLHLKYWGEQGGVHYWGISPYGY